MYVTITGARHARAIGAVERVAATRLLSPTYPVRL